MFLSWLLFFFGIWIIISAGLSRFTPWYNVINFIVGILIAIFSFWSTKAKKQEE